MSSSSSRQYVALLLLLLSSIVPSSIRAWMLSQLGLNESYHVRHIAMHYGRVFLSIEVASNTFPTLIESRWPDVIVGGGGGYPAAATVYSTVFPSIEAHDIDPDPETRNCRHIQRSIWTQVDGLQRLWVMDIGWRNSVSGTTVCHPKLLLFDLLRDNAEVLRIDCSRYIKPNAMDLLAIKLGPPTQQRCRGHFERFIYFLRADDSRILAYDIIEQRWQQRLLISSKYAQVLPEMLPIKPNDLAFGGGDQRRQDELLISDVDGALFSTTNVLLRHEHGVQTAKNIIDRLEENPRGTSGNSTCETANLSGQLVLKHLGSLLGPSRGMMVDLKNVLYYVVPKYGAVVRCPQYRKNLTAEGNEIIYMTSKNIQQIFFGSEDSVWLVSDRVLHPNDHCFAGMA